MILGILLVGHVYIIFGDMPVQIFCLFYFDRAFISVRRTDIHKYIETAHVLWEEEIDGAV